MGVPMRGIKTFADKSDLLRYLFDLALAQNEDVRFIQEVAAHAYEVGREHARKENGSIGIVAK